VSVVGNIQPDVLNDLGDERGREDGFIHRILFAYPDRMPRQWTDASVAPEVLRAASTVFDNLWELTSENSSDEGERAPVALPFTHDAKQLWRAWITDHYNEQEAPDFPENLAGPWAKLEGYTARFALIIHLARWASGEPVNAKAIDAASMACAAEITDYFKSHARRVYTHLHATPDDKRVLTAVAWIRRQPQGQTTARAILRAGVAGVHTSDEAKALLITLAERGYGACEEVGAPHGKSFRFVFRNMHPTPDIKE